MTAEILMESPELPPEIDVDGVFDEATGIEYVGTATRNAEGRYVCLAKVPNPESRTATMLCRVEVTVRQGKPPPKAPHACEFCGHNFAKEPEPVHRCFPLKVRRRAIEECAEVADAYRREDNTLLTSAGEYIAKRIREKI